MSLRVGSVTARLFQTITISPSAVNANSFSVETYTLNGVQTDMLLHAAQETEQAGLVLLRASCLAVNVLELTWFNGTGSPITPTASQVVKVVGF